MRRAFADIADGLKETFTRPAYASIGILVALIAAAATSWAVNARVILFLIDSPWLSPTIKAHAVLQQLAGTFLLFRPMQVALIVIASLLLGANLAIAACYLHHRFMLGRSMGLGLLGALIALFGVGCASCGSVLVLVLLGSSAGAFVIRALPLGGFEFGIVGCLIMCFSAGLAAARIPHAQSCSLPAAARLRRP